MADCIIPHYSIALELSTLWQFIGGNRGAAYIASIRPDLPPMKGTIERLYIARAMEGSIENRCVGSIVYDWWVVDDYGYESTISPSFVFSDNESELHATATIRFFASGDRIVLWEHLSTGFIIQKAGNITHEPGWWERLEYIADPLKR